MPEMTQAVADKATAIQNRLNTAVSDARKNADLTADGKRKAIAKAYLTAQKDMDDLRASFDGNAARDSVTLAKDIFGAATTAGLDAIAARDADDRAARLENAGAAAELLQRAEENGDAVLARAVAQRAYRERGGIFAGPWQAVLDMYTETRPRVAEKLDELESARRNTIRDNLTAGMYFSLQRPPEIGSATGNGLAAMAGM